MKKKAYMEIHTANIFLSRFSDCNINVNAKTRYTKAAKNENCIFFINESWAIKMNVKQINRNILKSCVNVRTAQTKVP
jgi:hypothetical protein